MYHYRQGELFAHPGAGTSWCQSRSVAVALLSLDLRRGSAGRLDSLRVRKFHQPTLGRVECVFGGRAACKY